MAFWGEHIIPTLTAGQYLGLALMTALVAGALALEHYAIGRRCWPRRHYYAIGLLTDAGLLLAWAGVEQVHLNFGTSLLLLVAGCLAGVPDWILLQRRDKRLLTAWRAMIERNQRLAGQLARARLVCDQRNAERIENLVEGVGFNLVEMRLSLEAMQVISSQLEPILVQFLAICQDGATEPKHERAD